VPAAGYPKAALPESRRDHAPVQQQVAG